MSPLQFPMFRYDPVPSSNALEGHLRYPPTLNRFFTDEHGQDLIEYGLLLGILVSGLALLLPILASRMGDTFTNFGANSNNIWVPSDPP